MNSARNMEVQKENMSLAEEVYEISRLKYQQGVGSNLEVIDADAAFKQAQTNYYSALYNTLISKVDYQKSLGKLY
jgi:outer membrane protein TolC